MHTFIS